MGVDAEFHGLIVHSRGTLSDNEVREIVEFVEAQEFNLALETLCGFLVDQNRRVTPELYFRIHSLSERLDGVDPYLLSASRRSSPPLTDGAGLTAGRGGPAIAAASTAELDGRKISSP
jgi:hypothetical protein